MKNRNRWDRFFIWASMAIAATIIVLTMFAPGLTVSVW